MAFPTFNSPHGRADCTRKLCRRTTHSRCIDCGKPYCAYCAKAIDVYVGKVLCNRCQDARGDALRAKYANIKQEANNGTR